MIELATLFSALLSSYPAVMKPLSGHSSEELADLIIETHERLSQGSWMNAPDVFANCVKAGVPAAEWNLAVSSLRAMGRGCLYFEKDTPGGAELEQLTLELLWLSALITEFQRRGLRPGQETEFMEDWTLPVQ